MYKDYHPIVVALYSPILTSRFEFCKGSSIYKYVKVGIVIVV